MRAGQPIGLHMSGDHAEASGWFAHGYGPYYGYNDDGYGYGDCYIQRRVYVDQFGRRFVRPVRVTE
jgi:hypothetical protein